MTGKSAEFREIIRRQFTTACFRAISRSFVVVTDLFRLIVVMREGLPARQLDLPAARAVGCQKCPKNHSVSNYSVTAPCALWFFHAHVLKIVWDALGEKK